MRVSFLLVILALSEAVFAKSGDECTLPNGEKATCKPARLCDVIVKEIKKGNDIAVTFVRNSECGYDNEQLVCCGSNDFLNSSFSVTARGLDIINGILPDRTTCGLQNLTFPTISGGEQTEFGELPWVAALHYNKKNSNETAGIRCGGSVINNRYILTAAHCLGDPTLDLTEVHLGEWDTKNDPDCKYYLNYICADPVQKFKIERRIVHRFFDRHTLNNDIALLKLDHDIQFSKYVRPICLPLPDKSPSSPGTRMTVSGWGTTENGTTSDYKLKVDVPVVSNVDCKITQEIPSNQLCAGGEPEKDACKGDSGGPLMVSYKDTSIGADQWYQEGIVSRGSGCAVNTPSMYTRVGKYIKWIMRNVSK